MATQLQVQDVTPPLKWDEAGGARIGESRVTLDSVIAAYDSGATPEEIAIQFPALALADIYAVISFYLYHPLEVRAYVEARQQQSAESREERAERHGLGDLRERLLKRRGSRAQ